MEISVKLTSNQIGYLSGVLENSIHVTPAQFINLKREAKVVVSIVFDISEKFEDKFRKLSKTLNLFDEKKKHKITLKFYQAHALTVLLHGIRTNEKDPYKWSMAENIYNLIEKQLI